MRLLIDANILLDVLQKLALVFKFADLTADDLAKAAEMKWDDFEDAVQSVTAEWVHADYIITRNVCNFKNSKVMAFMPSEYIVRL